jgi:hypothetical protein
MRSVIVVVTPEGSVSVFTGRRARVVSLMVTSETANETGPGVQAGPTVTLGDADVIVWPSMVERIKSAVPAESPWYCAVYVPSS